MPEELRRPNVTDEVAGQPSWRRLAKACALLLVGAAAHLWLPSAMEPPRSFADAGQPAQAGARASDVVARSTPDAPPIVIEEARVDPRPLDLMGAERMTPALASSDGARLVPVGTRGGRAPDRPAAAPERPAPEAPRVVARPPRAAASERPRPVARTEDNPRPGDALVPASFEAPSRSMPSREAREVAPAPALPAAERTAPPQDPPPAILQSSMPANAARALASIEPPPEEGIQRVLQAYRSAFERLDAAAAKDVWPTVDARALGYAFSQLAEQRLTFDSCGISVSGDAASARCRGQAEYLPKVGGKRALVTSGEWVFDLAKHEADWQIVAANVK